MKEYSLNSLLFQFGASGYLRCLRNRYRAGLYSHERFALLAASAYMLLLKPKRALALLSTIDEKKTAPETRKQINDIESQALALSLVPSSPTCSLNMIAKNEQNNIAAALDSIDDIMDEIVVCDTGSTDATIDFARLYGATVFVIAWRDDFSHARNEAIAKSTCSWIMWMDADDRFESTSKSELVSIIKTAHCQAASFCVVNEQNNLPGAHFMQVRLFPRMEGLRFERRVHEQIVYGAERNRIPFAHYPSIRFIHKGYCDPALRNRKAGRNKALLKAELKRYPNDPALLISYADCCMALGQTHEAITVYEHIIGARGLLSTHAHIAIQARYNAASLCYTEKKFPQARQLLAECIRLDPSRTEAYYMLGRIFEEQGDDDLAFDEYLKAARIQPPVHLTATDALTVRIKSIHCLARLLIKVGRYSDAEELLSHAIEEFPGIVGFHSAMGTAMLNQQKLKQAATFFMQSLSLCADRNQEAFEGMARIYETMRDYTKARLFKDMAVKVWEACTERGAGS